MTGIRSGYLSKRFKVKASGLGIRVQNPAFRVQAVEFSVEGLELMSEYGWLKVQVLGLHWGYIGIRENKMEIAM